MSRHAATLLVALVLVVTGTLAGSLAGARPAAADTYDPAPGARMNNPQGGSSAKYKIHRHLIRSVYSAPRGSRIAIASWNIRSHAAAKALVRAHRRGVTVQLIMDRINAEEHDLDPSNPIPADNTRNDDWFWMKREFRKNNNRRAGYRSWARTCARSCRGTSGLPHTKMFIFEKVHRTRHVVMWSSANFTGAAATAQWNDIYTARGRFYLWKYAMRRFQEMARDQNMANAWRVKSFDKIRFGVFPWKGAGTSGDPVRRVLNQVRCTGARAGSGNSNHRTVIKIAQTALNDARGRAIASTVKRLWNEGCDIRMIYGLMGPRIKKILRARSGRGPVPMRQMAQDFDGDFIYDRYLHQKVMTISGNWSGSRQANFTWNGSANWTGYTLASDEVFSRIRGRRLLLQYNRFINHWFANPPRNARGTLPASYARLVGIDPYAKFEIN